MKIFKFLNPFDWPDTSGSRVPIEKPEIKKCRGWVSRHKKAGVKFKADKSKNYPHYLKP